MPKAAAMRDERMVIAAVQGLFEQALKLPVTFGGQRSIQQRPDATVERPRYKMSYPNRLEKLANLRPCDTITNQY